MALWSSQKGSNAFLHTTREIDVGECDVLRVGVEMWKANLEFFFWATVSLTAFFWLEPLDAWLDKREMQEKINKEDGKKMFKAQNRQQ